MKSTTLYKVLRRVSTETPIQESKTKANETKTNFKFLTIAQFTYSFLPAPNALWMSKEHLLSYRFKT